MLIIIMVCCVAFGCKNHQDRQTIRDGKKISYFNFPNPEKENHRAQSWLENIGTGFTLKTFKFTKNKRICSDHFHENCYEIDRNAVLGYERTKRRLKEGAIPTIFTHKVFQKINMNGETVTIRPPQFLKRIQETAQKEIVAKLSHWPEGSLIASTSKTAETTSNLSTYKEERPAELMGTSSRRKLKKTAVPTLFSFATPKRKRRKDSIDKISGTIIKKQLTIEKVPKQESTTTYDNDKCVGTVEIKTVLTQAKERNEIPKAKLNNSQETKEQHTNTDATFSTNENVKFVNINTNNTASNNRLGDINNSEVLTVQELENALLALQYEPPSQMYQQNI